MHTATTAAHAAAGVAAHGTIPSAYNRSGCMACTELVCNLPWAPTPLRYNFFVFFIFWRVVAAQEFTSYYRSGKSGEEKDRVIRPVWASTPPAPPICPIPAIVSTHLAAPALRDPVEPTDSPTGPVARRRSIRPL